MQHWKEAPGVDDNRNRTENKCIPRYTPFTRESQSRCYFRANRIGASLLYTTYLIWLGYELCEYACTLGWNMGIGNSTRKAPWISRVGLNMLILFIVYTSHDDLAGQNMYHVAVSCASFCVFKSNTSAARPITSARRHPGLSSQGRIGPHYRNSRVLVVDYRIWDPATCFRVGQHNIVVYFTLYCS